MEGARDQEGEDAAPERRRDLDRWLGDGGMPLLDALGASIDAYGVDGEDLGWVEGVLRPEPLACNPWGTVQAGVHAVLLDACMNFAVNAALAPGDRSRATLELHIETLRPAAPGERYAVRAEVTRLARQVAFAEGTVRDAGGQVMSRATGTFILARAER